MRQPLPLIVVRPEETGAATVAAARQMGLDAHHLPLFSLDACAWDAGPPSGYDAILLTSANAARLAGPGLAAYAALPVYAVGPATAAAAAAAGLTVRHTGGRGGGGDGAALVRAAWAAGVRRPLWLAGAVHRPLAWAGGWLTPTVVYRADPLPPPPSWAQLVAAPVVIAVHSPRAAARVANLLAGRAGHVALAALSPAVATAAGGGWREIAVATARCDAALLETARRLCHNPAVAAHEEPQQRP